MLRSWAVIGVAAVVTGGLLIPVGGGIVEEQVTSDSPPILDLTVYSSDPPAAPCRMLFIHHSCGGQWLADPGPDEGVQCIYESYPKGGGLRRELEAAGYEVHEASYGSVIGQHTDVFDWPPKFQSEMNRVLATEHQDQTYADDRRNQIVAFKSCFPNNLIQPSAAPGQPEPAGDPAGPALTIANAKAAYRALLPVFERQRGVLFVCITAPPVAPWAQAEPLWKRLAKKLMGKPSSEERLLRSAEVARQFNDWLKSTEGWLQDYTTPNVVVFDLYDVLTDEGASNLSRYPTRGGRDSHPSREGYERATRAFVPFLNRAVRWAGLHEPGASRD